MERKLLLLLLYTCLFLSPCYAQEASLPVFIENKGQWDEEVLFRAAIPNGFLFLKKEALQFSFYDQTAVKALHHTHDSSHEHKHQHRRQFAPSSRIQAYSYEVKLLATSPKVTFHKKAATKATPYQFFLGNQSHRWASNVQSYSEVVYQDVYPGIDLRLFKKGQKLKYEFLVAPGADYQKIQLQYQHTHNLQLKEGHLEIPTPFGTVIESHPISFQQVSGKWKKIASSFQLKDNIVSFEIDKNYRRTQRLLIDPELVFSTFSGSPQDNWGNTATYDGEGNLYSGGIVFGMGFPTTTGAFDVDFNGNIDMGIIKYNATGTNALYITYLGGIAAETPHSLVVDQNGDLLVLGSTSSNDFPTTAGALQSTFNGGIPFSPFGGVFYTAGSDLIVSKLSNDGTQLLQSTYIGGNQNDGVNLSNATVIRNYGDSFRGDIITDSLNFIYIATTTESSDFPQVNAYQSTSAGAQEAVVMKLPSDLSSIVWSTFLGGSEADFGHSIKLNANNEVYVGGATQSDDFPTSPTAMIPTYPLNSNEKGFIAQFDDAGNFLAATYVGANQASQIFFIDLDPEGNVYAFGNNVGSYPVSAGVYQNANSGQFIHKLSGDLTTSLLSTVIGSGDGQPDISPTAFLVNECGNIYLTGWGGIVNTGSNPSSSTFGLPVTADAFDSNTDGSDFYIMVLEKDFNSLLYATFLGGSDEDHVDGGTSRFAKDGTIYHATCACGGFFDNFPTTPGAWSRTNNSFNCNNAAFKFNTDILQADFQILDPVTLTEISEGCTDLEVILRYDGIGAREATWEIIGLDTISQTTVTDIPYTFRTGGTYPIRLTVRNQASCTQEVIVEKNIEVFPTNFQVIGEQTICFGASVTLSASGTGNTQFAWSPAASLSDTTLANPVASPVDTTLYQVQMSDENGCTTTETVRVNVLPDIQPSFTWQLVKDCGQPARIGFVNTSQNADTYTWLIDGQTFDTFTPPPYLYDEESPQEVTLIARNILCSKSITQSVQPEYLTPFSVSAPATICEGESIQLQANGSLSYQWSPTERMEGADSNQPIVRPDTTTLYTVSLTDISGCRVDSTVLITVVPTIDFDITIDLQEECGKPTAAVFTNQSTGAERFTWDLGDGTTFSGEQPEAYVYESPGTYTITVEGEIGNCTYATQQTIEVLNTSVAIANVITPNGDAYNETFELVGEPFQIEIFNRWGKRVFQSSNYQNDWGAGVEAGMYYYLITSETGQICKGWVQVLR